MKKIKQLV